MNKRRILAVLIALVLTIAATAMWSASTIQREGDPDAIVLEDSGSEAGVDGGRASAGRGGEPAYATAGDDCLDHGVSRPGS